MDRERSRLIISKDSQRKRNLSNGLKSILTCSKEGDGEARDTPRERTRLFVFWSEIWGKVGLLVTRF